MAQSYGNRGLGLVVCRREKKRKGAGLQCGEGTVRGDEIGMALPRAPWHSREHSG